MTESTESKAGLAMDMGHRVPEDKEQSVSALIGKQMRDAIFRNHAFIPLFTDDGEVVADDFEPRGPEEEPMKWVAPPGATTFNDYIVSASSGPITGKKWNGIPVTACPDREVTIEPPKSKAEVIAAHAQKLAEQGKRVFIIAPTLGIGSTVLQCLPKTPGGPWRYMSGARFHESGGSVTYCSNRCIDMTRTLVGKNWHSLWPYEVEPEELKGRLTRAGVVPRGRWNDILGCFVNPREDTHHKDLEPAAPPPPRFKVGDKVRVLPTADKSVAGKLGTVAGINRHGIAQVQYDDRHREDWWEPINPRHLVRARWTGKTYVAVDDDGNELGREKYQPVGKYDDRAWLGDGVTANRQLERDQQLRAARACRTTDPTNPLPSLADWRHGTWGL
jgi:hypothetical protein